jgi:hypothetical protein
MFHFFSSKCARQFGGSCAILHCILIPSLQSGGQLRDLIGSDFILISDEDETERPTSHNSCIHGM